MAQDARTQIVQELVSEFVEDRVRQAPDRSFGMGELKRSLGEMLKEADLPVDLRSADEAWMSDWLDRHPLLLREQANAPAAWRPGFNKEALARM